MPQSIETRAEQLSEPTPDASRAEQLFDLQKERICIRTDKLFAWLFLLQWIGSVVWSLIATPKSWEGSVSSIHIHVSTCIAIGAIIVSLPLYLIFKRPGNAVTRQVVAAAQMLLSGLLIAASGGRIETHFHVFGSLAFLAFYRDWRVLITASLVTAIDHITRGIYSPDTIYGVSFAEPWRWVEHALWVVFCDIFLIYSIVGSTKDMKLMAQRQAELESSKDSVEQEVRERTAELRLSEQNLKESEATLRAIFESAADSIITVSEDGSIEAANQTCENMFGWQFHKIFGKHVSFLVKELRSEPCDKHKWQQVQEQCRTYDRALRIEGKGRHRDGNFFPIEVSLSYVDLKGRKLLTAIIRDISERKEAERRVSEFYSIVSHELRTPLTSIRGSLGLIEGGLTGELSSETEELIGIARESCDRLIRLINDILDLKKLESGRFEFHKLDSNPADLLDLAIAHTQGFASARGVKLVVEESCSDTVLVDPDRLQQVLVNLVSNAIKYSPQGATVSLFAANEGNFIRFAVKDSGKGIPKEKHSKLFQKFQQLDSSDQREQEGTGLGLAICKAIVEQHGGEVGVESREGLGATFWFKIPRNAERVSEDEAGSLSRYVIVIEEADNLSKMLGSHLLPERCRVERTGSSLEASRLIAESVPDMVIFNITNPDSADFELHEKLRVLNSKHGKPVVLFASAEAPDSQPVLVDWHKAPVKQERLLDGVERALDANNCPVVLVVEDDFSTRKTVVHQLETKGVKCIEAEGGKEALRLVASQSPQLIVLDVGLPDMDGFQFVKELKEGESRSTPVLVYTGRDLSTEERKLLTVGFTRYLTKSKASQEDLLKAVEELLASMNSARDSQSNKNNRTEE